MRPSTVLLVLFALACTRRAEIPDAGTPHDAGSATPPPVPAVTWGRTFAFDCPGGTSFIVREGTTQVGVLVGDRTEVLPQVPAASGAKYERGGLVFWIKGDEATFDVDGKTWSGCRNDAPRAIRADARLRGVDVRGIGQEPGWLVEVFEGERIFVSADYGERKVEMPKPTRAVEDPITTWRAKNEAHEVLVRMEEKACTDVMSGQPYPATMTLVFDGKTYTGCGERLE